MNRLETFYFKAFTLITIYLALERDSKGLESEPWLIEVAKIIDVEVKELVSVLLVQYQKTFKGVY